MLGRDRNTSTGRRLLFPLIGFFTIAISLVMLLSARSDMSGATAGQTKVTDAIILPLTLFSLPLRGSEQAIENARMRKTALEENQKLKVQINALNDVKMRADILALRIKRYEEMLKADPGIDIPFQRIPARIVSESDGPFARSALLNAGAKSGVKTGYAVMTEHGLYGHVIAVGRSSSRVLQLQDINSRIAVLTPRTEARAIMIGTNGARSVLSYVDDKVDWQDGDVVMTSGDEGVLPQGLPIGVVRKNKDKRLFVELYSDKSTKDWVYVFAFTPILPPEADPAIEKAGRAVSGAGTEGAEGNMPEPQNGIDEEVGEN